MLTRALGSPTAPPDLGLRGAPGPRDPRPGDTGPGPTGHPEPGPHGPPGPGDVGPGPAAPPDLVTQSPASQFLRRWHTGPGPTAPPGLGTRSPAPQLLQHRGSAARPGPAPGPYLSPARCPPGPAAPAASSVASMLDGTALVIHLDGGSGANTYGRARGQRERAPERRPRGSSSCALPVPPSGPPGWLRRCRGDGRWRPQVSAGLRSWRGGGHGGHPPAPAAPGPADCSGVPRGGAQRPTGAGAAVGAPRPAEGRGLWEWGTKGDARATQGEGGSPSPPHRVASFCQRRRTLLPGRRGHPFSWTTTTTPPPPSSSEHPLTPGCVPSAVPRLSAATGRAVPSRPRSLPVCPWPRWERLPQAGWRGPGLGRRRAVLGRGRAPTCPRSVASSALAAELAAASGFGWGGVGWNKPPQTHISLVLVFVTSIS